MAFRSCKYNLLTLSLVLCLLSSSFSFSQSFGKNIKLTLPVIAILDIEPNTNNKSLGFEVSEAGDAITLITKRNKWLNYTSAIELGGSSRNISVSIDRTIQGVDIDLQVFSATGSGGGALGTTVGTITLTTLSQIIISGIGGAYTGDGSQNGHKLRYSLNINDYSSLSTLTDETVVVTYTISN